MPPVHKVHQKTRPEEQMDREEWTGSATIGGVCDVYSTQRGLLKDLYCPCSFGGGLSMRAFLSHCFHCISKGKKNEMAVNILSREKQKHKRSQGFYYVRVETYTLSQ